LKQLTLRPMIYGQYKNRLFSTVQKQIQDVTSDLDVRVECSITRNTYVHLTINGPDEEFVFNMMVRDYGAIQRLDHIKEGSLHLGQLIDVGKVGYGLYVGIGVIQPKAVDALIPLHRLREQTKMRSSSLRHIASSLQLIEHLPVEVHITEVSVPDQKIEAELSEGTCTRLDQWIHDDHERLIVLGATGEMIDTTLARTDHTEDIYEIEKLGPFEHALRCKRSTRATGIVSAIGPMLRGVPMHLFIPPEVEAMVNAAA
jgi:hypothetical protein